LVQGGKAVGRRRRRVGARRQGSGATEGGAVRFASGGSDDGRSGQVTIVTAAGASSSTSTSGHLDVGTGQGAVGARW
jgi:hypothetical protein